MKDLLVLGVDVGSVRRKGGFAWASGDASLRGEDDPSVLADVVVAAINAGRHVAMAFECPLSVPVPGNHEGGWKDLGRARTGEGNRSWSVGAGTGALATGLVQLSWVLSYVRETCTIPPRVTTQLERFPGEAAILLAEAMVTSDGKPEPVDGLQDHADAVAAAERLEEILTSSREGPAANITCAPHAPLNLAAVSAMHAGLAICADELHLDVIVAKVHPVTVN